MRSFEVFLHPEAEVFTPQRRQRRTRGTRALLDVFVRGANVTARVADGQALSALVDLANATLHLSASRFAKRIVHFHDEACELCLERDGDRAFLSVYRTGQHPEVYVYDRELPFRDIVHGVRESMVRVLSHEPGPKSGTGLRKGGTAALCAELSALLERFERLEPSAQSTGEPTALLAEILESTSATAAPVEPAAVDTVRLETPADLGVCFQAELRLRVRGERRQSDRSQAEISDLHALLKPGSVALTLGQREVRLGALPPFLCADRMVSLVERSLSHVQAGGRQPLSISLRLPTGGDDADKRTVAIRLTGERLALTFSTAHGAQTFPGLALLDFAQAALAFGSSLSRALLRHDGSQAKNLRLGMFRQRLRGLRQQLGELMPSDHVINEAPESYRAYAEHIPSKSAAAPAQASRMRFSPTWSAMVPGLELGSTFSCGARLILSSQRELFCLGRDDGQVRWQQPVSRGGVSVSTPDGIVRIGNDGALALHDWETGEISLRSWSTPRGFGPPSGVVVHGPGLPRLLVMTDGERHLLAVDLRTGDARWRYAWAAKGTQAATSGAQLRLRRHGKLLYLSTGDGALTALDVVTGQVVWRMRDPLRFASAPVVQKCGGFAIAGGQGAAAALVGFDPYSGRARFRQVLPKGAQFGSMFVNDQGPLLLVARQRAGLSVLGFDRECGAPLFSTPVVAPAGTGWLSLGDRLVGNTPGGELIGLCSKTGQVLYRTRLGRQVESDVPRQLEPIARGGVLFVPHADVQIVRPDDGTVLGSVGAKEAIPDLLRVDDRCSVFTAEESGHVAVYEARARLSLVS